MMASRHSVVLAATFVINSEPDAINPRNRTAALPSQGCPMTNRLPCKRFLRQRQQRGENTMTNKAKRHQKCSICRNIPDHTEAFWKGDELLSNDLPSAENELEIVGAPFYPKPRIVSTYYSSHQIVRAFMGPPTFSGGIFTRVRYRFCCLCTSG